MPIDTAKASMARRRRCPGASGRSLADAVSAHGASLRRPVVWHPARRLHGSGPAEAKEKTPAPVVPKVLPRGARPGPEPVMTIAPPAHAGRLLPIGRASLPGRPPARQSAAAGRRRCCRSAQRATLRAGRPRGAWTERESATGSQSGGTMPIAYALDASGFLTGRSSLGADLSLLLSAVAIVLLTAGCRARAAPALRRAPLAADRRRDPQRRPGRRLDGGVARALHPPGHTRAA